MKTILVLAFTLVSLNAFAAKGTTGGTTPPPGPPGKVPCCCKVTGKHTVHLKQPPCNDSTSSGWVSIFVTPGTCINGQTQTQQHAGCLLN